ncbi:MAG: SGNH/GDSL hydrolase family protein [Phycisphaerales bacterium]|nr:SGNH/GDSL hydrolase family protein [Phycisphaerales bacterium]
MGNGVFRDGALQFNWAVLGVLAAAELAAAQSGLPYTIAPPGDAVAFGQSVASGGDVDGDALPDVFVADPAFANEHGVVGRWSLFSGADGQLLWTVTGDQTCARLAAPVAINLGSSGVRDLVLNGSCNALFVGDSLTTFGHCVRMTQQWDVTFRGAYVDPQTSAVGGFTKIDGNLQNALLLGRNPDETGVIEDWPFSSSRRREVSWLDDSPDNQSILRFQVVAAAWQGCARLDWAGLTPRSRHILIATPMSPPVRIRTMLDGGSPQTDPNSPGPCAPASVMVLDSIRGEALEPGWGVVESRVLTGKDIVEQTDAEIVLLGCRLSVPEMARGFEVGSHSWGGATSTDHADASNWDPAMLADEMRATETNLVIIKLGQNDAGGWPLPRSEFKANIEVIIEKYTAACAPGVRFLLVSTWETASRGAALAEYADAMFEIAAADPARIAFCDLFRYVRDELGPWDAWHETYLRDGIHANNAGDDLFGSYLWTMINTRDDPVARSLNPLLNHEYMLTGAIIGDLDGDRKAEVLVGIPNADDLRGAASVFSGATGARLFEYRGVHPGDLLGLDVEGLADLNGDFVREFAIITDADATDRASLTIYDGATGERYRPGPVTPYPARRLRDGGDLDDDHVGDLIIGTRSTSAGEPRGEVLALSGRTGEVLWSEERGGGLFGSAILAGADYSGDDVPDVASTFGPDGKIVLLSGADGAEFATIDPPPGVHWDALWPADLNGDGECEIAAMRVEGARFGADVVSPSDGGEVHWAMGSAPIAPLRSISGNELAVADVNGDGADDLIIGSVGSGARILGGNTLLLNFTQRALDYRLTPGRSYGFQISGAKPERVVHVLGSLTGNGCTMLPQLGICMDLQKRLYYVGQADVDARGMARFTLDVPTGAPPCRIWMQTIDPADPARGAIKSNVMELEVTR